jgi:pimeloyl-ACP methyl ester carboxylesterase
VLKEITSSAALALYRKTGNGNKTLVLFHGFGQNHKAFDTFLPELENTYTVYSFDLFYHGGSTWNQDSPVTPKDWNVLFTSFLHDNNIQSFDMMAFSIGSRFLFTTLSLFPSNVNKVFLIAPDGIKISRWYTLATMNPVARNIFKRILFSTKGFDLLTKMALVIKVVDKATVKILQRQLARPGQRELVYNTWTNFRKLHVPLQEMSQIILKQNIDLQVLVAKQDTIITFDRIKPLIDLIPNAQLIAVDASHHQLLQQRFLSEFSI